MKSSFLPLIKLCAMLLLSLMVYTNVWAATVVTFYIVAHQDDWQLFMVPNAYRDAQSANVKVVFIYTTAGDAGLGTGTAGRKKPLYLARENGAINAVRFMVDSASMPMGESRTLVDINGHRINRYAYKNTVSYFLRLPDGNITAMGYAATGYQSLKKLMDGSIAQIRAIDGSATYFGWNDFTATLEQIIMREGAGVSTIWVNTADINETLNPGDHPDHIATGYGVLDAISRIPCISIAMYIEYSTANRPTNLAFKDLIDEAAVFGITVSGITNFDNQGRWDKTHKAFLGRNYLRTIPSTTMCQY